MARFRYRMQSILDIKEKLESQARQELAAAQMALNEELKRLEALEERKAGYEAEAAGLLSGTLKILDIEENKEAILKMEEYILLQQDRIRIAEKQVE